MLNNVKRNILKCITKNLGYLYQDDDSVLCFITKDDFKKNGDEYFINLDKNNNLNKPIHYIMDNEKFNDKVNIIGNDACTLLIYNCHFNNDLEIEINGICEIDCTFINSLKKVILSSNDLIIKYSKIKTINRLNFDIINILINAYDSLCIKYSSIGKLYENMNIMLNSLNEMNIENCAIYGNDIDIDSNEMNIENCAIYGNDIDIDSNCIEINDDTLLSLDDKLRIKSNNINYKCFTDDLKLYSGYDIKSKSKTLLKMKTI